MVLLTKLATIHELQFLTIIFSPFHLVCFFLMKWFLCLFIQMCHSKAYDSSSPLYFLHVPLKFDRRIKQAPQFLLIFKCSVTKHFRMQSLKVEPEEMHMCEIFESNLSRKTDNFKNFLRGFLTLPSSLHPYYEISWRKWRPQGGSYKRRHSVSISAITGFLK